MTDRARKVLADAMALPPEDRANVVAELLDSLPNDGLHPDWAAELERRARDAYADPEGGEPWDAVEQRLRSRLPSG